MKAIDRYLENIHTILGDGTHYWKQGKPVSYAITFTCELAFILFGIEQGIIGNLTSGDDFLNQFGHPTGSYLGIIVSIYTLGCFFGCILNYFIGDKLGRRLTILLAMILVIIGVMLQSCSYTVAHLMVGRIICGFGTGLETSCVPMYQSEMSRAEVRGNLVCSEALFVGIGLCYAYWLTYGLSFCSGSIAWRLPIATQIIFALIVFFLLFTIPESPRYLYTRGDKEGCKKNLYYVFGGKDNGNAEVEQLYQDIEEAHHLESLEGEYTWKKLFTQKDSAKTRHRLILSYMSMFAQQVGGVNLVNYYITTVLMENVGLDRNLAMILGGCIVIAFTVGSLVPSFCSDSLGRRLPLVWGFLGCCICMLVISVCLSYQNTSLSKETGEAAVAFFFLFELVFGASGNCIPWVLVPELLPLHARNRGTALGISANWLWNFFIVEITPTMITNITWRSYIVFTVTNFAFSLMFFFFYPETKGLTLESIDKVFVEKDRLCMGFVNTRVYLNHGGDDIEANEESIAMESAPLDYKGDSKGEFSHIETFGTQTPSFDRHDS